MSSKESCNNLPHQTRQIKKYEIKRRLPHTTICCLWYLTCLIVLWFMMIFWMTWVVMILFSVVKYNVCILLLIFHPTPLVDPPLPQKLLSISWIKIEIKFQVVQVPHRQIETFRIHLIILIVADIYFYQTYHHSGKWASYVVFSLRDP